MNIDSFYQIGAGHVVCQDRALHGKVSDCLFAVGADGCSCQNVPHPRPRTEIGAMLLCELARNQFEIHDGNYFSSETFKRNMLEEMRRMAAMLRLSQQIFDATLWILSSGKESIFVSGWGDGIVHAKYEDGSSTTSHVDFASGMPRYLSYDLDPARLEAYIQHAAGRKALIREYTNGEKEREDEFPVDDFCYHAQIFRETHAGAKLIFVSVFSDGACTFSKDSLPYSLTNIVKELTDYKSSAGPFVKRRMLKLKEQHAKEGVSHYDDLFCLTLTL